MDFERARSEQEAQVFEIEKQIAELKQKARELMSELPAQEISNYSLKNIDGSESSLLELFGDKDELILIHNMGPGCPYCTLWADGLSSSTPYFEDRCAFWLETDIDPVKLKNFSEERSWNFKVVSSEGTKLKEELGFQKVTEEGKSNWPGYSTFFREGEKIYRHATSFFGPGDEYCSIRPMMDRLKKGHNGWQPKYNQ